MAFVDDDHRDALIMEWQAAKEAKRIATEDEARLRKELCDELFTEETGTQWLQLGQGYKLKLVRGIDYKIVDDNAKISKAWTDLEELGVNPAGLIKYTAEIINSGYKNIPKQAKEIADSIVVSKPKSAILELIEPKG